VTRGSTALRQWLHTTDICATLNTKREFSLNACKLEVCTLWEREWNETSKMSTVT